MKTILLLWGGGGAEHEVSQASANYIDQTIRSVLAPDEEMIKCELVSPNEWRSHDGKLVELALDGRFQFGTTEKKIACVFPCIHGYPGETGDLLSFLQMAQIDFFGPGPDASKICFNKITTKLWAQALGIQTAPFMIIGSQNDYVQAFDFFKCHGDIFVKAASQGSSVGCYHVTHKDDLAKSIKEAFSYSHQVLLEKTIKGRELEASVYSLEQKIECTLPGEIHCPDQFYSYEEKYSSKAQTKTSIQAENLDQKVIDLIRQSSGLFFKSTGLKDFCRMDYFLEGQSLYLNEVNTMPGMTPISLFPKMIEASGLPFSQFLRKKLDELL